MLERSVCAAWVSARQGPFQTFWSPRIEAQMELLQPQVIRPVSINNVLRGAGRPLPAVVLGSGFAFADSQPSGPGTR